VALLSGRWELDAFIKILNDNYTVLQKMPIQTLNEALYLGSLQKMDFKAR